MNINFIKKIWFSIVKPSKYDDLINLGVKKSIKYFVSLIFILALILSLSGSFIQAMETQKIVKYLEENIPEFKFENVGKDDKTPEYHLSLNEDNVIILDNREFLKGFKNVVVVDTNIGKKDINKYFELATNENNCIIFIKDECVIVASIYNQSSGNNEQFVKKYKYEELINKTGLEITNFNKSDLLAIINNSSSTYHIIVYFIYYFFILFILFLLDIIALWFIVIIIRKALKKANNKKEAFCLSIYSLTLSLILYVIYVIVNYYLKINMGYTNIIILVIALIYVLIYILKKNPVNNE